MRSSCSQSRRSTCVSQAANDLNFTFVVDENQGDRLVEQLHELLIRAVPGDRVLGPTWEQLFGRPRHGQRARGAVVAAQARASCSRLLGERIVRLRLRQRDGARRRVDAARAEVREPRALCDEGQSASASILRELRRDGTRLRVRLARAKSSACSKCVPGHRRATASSSRPTSRRARSMRGHSSRACRSPSTTTMRSRRGPRCSAGARFSCASIRESGRGHHHHVRTAGAHSKFGVPVAELDALAARAERDRRADRRPACPQRQRRVRRRQLVAHGRDLLAELAARLPDVQRHRRGRRVWRARAVRSAGSGLRASSMPSWAPYALHIRTSRSGSSPAAMSWRPAACCSRASRSSKPRAACVTSAWRPE